MLASAAGVSLPWIAPMLKKTGLPSPSADALLVISRYLIVRPAMLLYGARLDDDLVGIGGGERVVLGRHLVEACGTSCGRSASR